MWSVVAEAHGLQKHIFGFSQCYTVEICPDAPVPPTFSFSFMYVLWLWQKRISETIF